MTLSLVIPAHNEEKNISAVVRNLVSALRNTGIFFEIVVVDNGSTDNTAVVLEKIKNEIKELRTIQVFPNLGYGNGILAGLRIAEGDILGWMHADNQIKTKDVVAIYHKLKNENLDLCKVVRTKRDEHWMRIIQSRVYNTFFSLLFGGRLRDINGTPKIFSRSLYEKAGLVSRDWFIDPEIVIKSLGYKARVGEVEVNWSMRPGGSSHVSFWTWLQFVKNMVKYKMSGKI